MISPLCKRMKEKKTKRCLGKSRGTFFQSMEKRVTRTDTGAAGSERKNSRSLPQTSLQHRPAVKRGAEHLGQSGREKFSKLAADELAVLARRQRGMRGAYRGCRAETPAGRKREQDPSAAGGQSKR